MEYSPIAILTTQIAVALLAGGTVGFARWSLQKIALLEAANERLAATAIERGALLDRLRAIDSLPRQSVEDHARLLTLQAGCPNDLWMHELLEARLYELEWTLAAAGSFPNPLRTDSDRRRAERFCLEAEKRGLYRAVCEEIKHRLRTPSATPSSASR